ncbi:hypothetical protein H0H93_016140, partial [Arthromyces matolae]
MAPYPGDPSNILQYKGERFYSYEIEGGNVCLWDMALQRDFVLPISVIACPTFEIGVWYAQLCSELTNTPITRLSWFQTTLLVDVWAWNAEKVLELGAPYVPNEDQYHMTQIFRFDLVYGPDGWWNVCDRLLNFRTHIEDANLKNPRFDIVNWYLRKLAREDADNDDDQFDPDSDNDWGLRRLFRMKKCNHCTPHRPVNCNGSSDNQDPSSSSQMTMLELNGQQVEAGTYPAIQRNGARRRNETRMVPKPLVIVIKLNGHPVRALVDS